MATYTKPTEVPRWADTSGNVVEPAEAKKDEGWVFEEIPPSSWENWRTKLNGEWWKWIDERWSDGATADAVRALFPLEFKDANFGVELAGTDALIHFDKSPNDRLRYDRSGNNFYVIIGGNSQFRVSDSEVDLEGNALVDASTIDASGDATFGTITMTGFSVDADGDTSVKSLNVNSGGISNAGNITGAASITATGIIAGGSLNLGTGNITCGGIDNNNEGITQAGAISGASTIAAGGQISGGSLNLGTGNITCGGINNNNEGITNAGAISGASSIAAGGVISGGSLNLGTGNITCGGIDNSNEGITQAGAISGASTIDATGDLSVGSITMSGNIYTTGQIGRDSNDYIDWQGDDYMSFVTNGVEEMRLDADGLRVLNGLYVGTITGPATDNDIYAQGSIACGTTIDASGDATFGTITMTGFSVDADGDVIGKTVRALNGPQLTSTGIAQAEAIAGATSIDGSGDLTMGTITMTGFTVDADGDTGMRTLTVTHPSSADARIGKFYDSRNSATKEYWIDFNANTSVGTEITAARMSFHQLEELLFGSGSRCAFDLELTRYGSSPSTVFNIFGTGEFTNYCWNFGLAVGSQLSDQVNTCNWIGANRHWVFSNTSTTSAVDKEIAFSVPPRAGLSGHSVSMINMDNSSSSNWVRIGGGMSNEDGATAVSIYVATALGATGSLAQSYSSSGLNSCFDRFFAGMAGLQLNNDSSTAGSGSGRLRNTGHRLRFTDRPGEGKIHSTTRTIINDLLFTGIGVSKTYKYLNPFIFDTDTTTDGDTVYVMVAGSYTNGASSSMNLGLAYEDDPVGAAGTYQDLIFKGVNLDTQGRFIIEAWITCRSSNNARYVARIQDAGSNQRVEFLTTNITWTHANQKKFYLIGQAFGENRSIDVDNGILGVS